MMTEGGAYALHLIATRLAECLSVGGRVLVMTPEGKTKFATIRWEVDLLDGAFLSFEQSYDATFLESLRRTDYIAESLANKWLERYSRIMSDSDA